MYPYSQPRRFPFPLQAELVEKLQLKIVDETFHTLIYRSMYSKILVHIDLLVEGLTPVFSIINGSILSERIIGIDNLIESLISLNYMPAIQMVRNDTIRDILKDLDA